MKGIAVSVLREIDAIRLRVLAVRHTTKPERNCVGPERVLIDVEYRNGNRGTVELTTENAAELAEMLRRLND